MIDHLIIELERRAKLIPNPLHREGYQCAILAAIDFRNKAKDRKNPPCQVVRKQAKDDTRII